MCGEGKSEEKSAAFLSHFGGYGIFGFGGFYPGLWVKAFMGIIFLIKSFNSKVSVNVETNCQNR